MKRVLALVMITALLLNLTLSSVMAAETVSDELVTAFVDNVFAMENKQQFVDLIDLIRKVDEPEALLDAYEEGFSGLTSSQQQRVESFGVSLDAMEAFVDYIMSETFDNNKLELYLGLTNRDEDQAAFQAAIEVRIDDFVEALETAGADVNLLTNGFGRMDKLFSFLNVYDAAIQLGLPGSFLIATTTNGDLTLDRDVAEEMIGMANDVLSNDIENVDTVLDAIDDFVDFYNNANSNDQSHIYKYLDDYGFIDLQRENNGGGRTNNGAAAAAIVEIVDILDDPVALAAPILQESGSVGVTGGTVNFAEANVAITVPEGAFEGDVTMTVDVFTEEDLIAGGAISLGYEDSEGGESLALAGAVYKFESDSDNSFEESVTVTIPVVLDEGFSAFHTLGIYQYDEFLGEWVFVGGTYDPETGTISVDLEHFSYYSVMAYTKTFDDIDDNWAAEYITYLASKHVINGRTASSYEPAGTLTRAEFAKLLVSVSEVEMSEMTDVYEDVSSEAWYAEVVATAYEAGIVDESDITTFRPNDNITREEMVTMLMNAYDLMADADYKSTYGDVATNFADSDDAQAWAKAAIAAANQLELVNGIGNDLFDPKGTAKRSEAAKIIKLLLDVVKSNTNA